MRKEVLKCQKNGTIVWEPDLGQAEEDSSDRPLPVHDNDMSVGEGKVT